jgi:trimethylamine--corrinoid protein Co-methyltransferase
MADVCMNGPGHYLGTERTLSHMERDCVYPALGNRMSPKEWAENDRPNLIEQTIARKEAILATRSAARFDPVLDAEIRKRFNIHLPA